MSEVIRLSEGRKRRTKRFCALEEKVRSDGIWRSVKQERETDRKEKIVKSVDCEKVELIIVIGVRASLALTILD